MAMHTMTDDASAMKPVPHASEIDLARWTFIDPTLADKMSALIGEAVAEALQETFEQDPPRLSFASEWNDSDGLGGKCPDDPATMYVSLPFGPRENDVYYSCSLKAAVDSVIDLHEDGDGVVTHPDGQKVCRKIAVRLRELADKLDNACKKEQP